MSLVRSAVGRSVEAGMDEVDGPCTIHEKREGGAGAHPEMRHFLSLREREWGSIFTPAARRARIRLQRVKIVRWAK